MQQSLARQMASVATAVAAAKSGSLKFAAGIDRKTIPECARNQPVTCNQPVPERNAAPAETAGDLSSTGQQIRPADAAPGFFANPWPAPDDFAIPNVQVQTDACEPLAQTDIGDLVKTASAKHGVGADLIRAVTQQESASAHAPYPPPERWG